MSNYGPVVQAQLEADPALKKRGKKILAILAEPDSPRKQRRLRVMELHTWAHLTATGAIDVPWSDNIDWNTVGLAGITINWPAVIQIVLQLLLAILPFLLSIL